MITRKLREFDGPRVVLLHIMFSSLALAAGLSLRSVFINISDIIMPKHTKLTRSLAEFIILSLLTVGFFLLFGREAHLSVQEADS